ncbi:MAG: 3',5'-cyclic-nucleotide phosphodiesterase [Thermoanaerobaculia bacterium]|nr:3',5'-cyclic-nucleotide phosphodiesterase [Thermoanaerobaculia bacterium]
MRLKVLGAYGSADATHNLTGYVIDDRVAIDAGTLGSKLTLLQQSKIEVIFITHVHADHIRDLPTLIENRFHSEAAPLEIVAEKSVMEMLHADVFNGRIWPDFEKFPPPHGGKPAVHYRALAAGKRTVVNGMGFTAALVDHTIPTSGVIIEIEGQAIAFTGDTGPTNAIWKKVNKTPGMVAMISEASYPNDYATISRQSGHLTPELFGAELAKIEVDAPLYASHRKLPYERKIESEIRNIRDRRARILVEKQYTF